MSTPLRLFDTAQKAKRLFSPLVPGRVGIYWCGPTPYGPTHLGHARGAIARDLLVRWLRHEGYKVRSVSNITDVGHLLHDADEGEDKIAHKARQESVSPMEVVQRYTLEYHRGMEALNILPPDIEPRATGHIIEQIELTERLLEKGYAYLVNGSVYFDVPAYHQVYGYGKLSGIDLEQMAHQSRELAGGEDKKSPLDFALWKRATPAHIMQWSSPWGKGFPGWHIECTAMSMSYLGLPFDLHGGGLELAFPHHECEWAQAEAAYGTPLVGYWLHHNMVTIGGKKMAKSWQNSITLEECFSGSHPLLSWGYPPMALRLLFLQAHYRSPIDFSETSLQMAEKSYFKLLHGVQLLGAISPSFAAHPSGVDQEIQQLCQASYEAMADDLNSPQALARLFLLLSHIHALAEKKGVVTEPTWEQLVSTYNSFFQDIFGLRQELLLDGVQLVNSLLTLYQKAKAARDYATVDWIRQELKASQVYVQDRRDGRVEWQYGE